MMRARLMLLAAAPLLIGGTSPADYTRRLAALDRAHTAAAARLAESQAPLARLLATRAGGETQPAVLAFARPGSIADIANTRALLTTLAPMIAARAEARRRRLVLTDAARDALIDRLDALDRIGASPRTRLTALPARLARPEGAAYRLPVWGAVAPGGDGTARGLTLATAPGARVTAPAAGWIAYAGTFKGYRGIVILDHGHGWTTLLAGLAVVEATPGTLAAAGAEVGAMPLRRPLLTIELRRHGRPVDVVRMAAWHGR